MRCGAPKTGQLRVFPDPRMSTRYLIKRVGGVHRSPDGTTFEAVSDKGHQSTPCDVYAPCARGAGLNDETIPMLRCRAVAGAANNQLLEPRHGDDLHARGILYAPDYAINAGGLVNVAQEVKGYDAKVAREKTLKIYDTIWDICDRSKKLNAPTYKVADLMAEERLAALGPART